MYRNIRKKREKIKERKKEKKTTFIYKKHRNDTGRKGQDIEIDLYE